MGRYLRDGAQPRESTRAAPYRLPDGRESAEAAAWWGRRESEILPPPNVMATHGLGPAWAAPEALLVLRALGLIEFGQWAATAEPVLWRKQPQEWRLDITADPRFQQALARAITQMPADIRREMEQLVTITEADVTDGLVRHEAHQKELRAEHGANRVICLPHTRESVHQAPVFSRIHHLDWLFFSNWRQADELQRRTHAKQARRQRYRTQRLHRGADPRSCMPKVWNIMRPCDP